MGQQSHRGDEPIFGINVTPFVDVMLVLLVIFMVTANYMNQQSIKVELPKAASGEAQDTQINLGFTIDAHSNVYLDGKNFDLATLAAHIEKLKSEGKQIQAIIGADQSAKHGDLLKVIDALRVNGVYDFALNVDPK